MDATMEFFISNYGSDKNIGTKSFPFATMSRALKEVKKIRLNRSSYEQIKLFFEDGIYKVTKPIEIEKIHSGNKTSSTIISAVHPGKVYLNGGVKISKTKFHSVEDNNILRRLLPNVKNKILEIDLAKIGFTKKELGNFGPRGFRRPYIPSFPELFIDNCPQSVARWPNKGDPLIPIKNVIDSGTNWDNQPKQMKGGKFVAETSRIQRWKNSKEIWISGFFNYGFADDTIRIKDIDFKTNIITTLHPHAYGFASGKPWQCWYTLNILEEIEFPGEYVVDKDSMKVFFYPPDTFDDNSKITLSKIREPLICIENASFIKIQGICFECGRGMGSYIEGGNDITFQNCVFRNFGMLGVCIGKGIEFDKEYRHNFTGTPISRQLGSWHEHIYSNPLFNRDAGFNHKIENCRIYNIGAGGISLGGGDRKSLTKTNNIIENSEIFNCNRLDRTYKAPINIDGVGNKIVRCKIYKSLGSAIYLHGNDHIIEYNCIFNTMEEGDDMGVFYMGRDPSEFNNIIRYNYFRNSGMNKSAHSTFGIYLDDASCGTQIYGNLFENVGKIATIFIGGGSYHEIRDNLFLDCKVAIRIDNRLKNWMKNAIQENGIITERIKLVNIEKPPYSKNYSALSNFWNENPEIPSNIVENNLILGKGKKYAGNKSWIIGNIPKRIRKSNRSIIQDDNRISLFKNEITKKIMIDFGLDRFFKNLARNCCFDSKK